MAASGTTCKTCGRDSSLGLLNGVCTLCLGKVAFASDEVEGRATRIVSAALSRSDLAESALLFKQTESRGIRPSITTRFGDYELLEEIARGGMGVVYKARQLSLNRVVAVKMILHGNFNHPEFVQRFRAEAEAAANLHHPNIVAIYEIGDHEGQLYFSMEYIEGSHLGALVREQPLPARRAAEYTRKIAEAVHYAHSRGVLHRDLKPLNVLIDLDGEPRVTDFGLAKRTDGSTNTSELTVTGQVLGSPSYMSPEQASGQSRNVDARTDVYALGALLYTLVTGRPPFMADSAEATLLQVTQAEPVPPRLLNPSLPRDVDTIVLKCLQKGAAARYSTARELAEDLHRFIRNEPIRARPVSLPEKTWRWCQRKPALASAMAAILILAVGGAVAITTEWRRAERNARAATVQRQEAERATLRALLAQAHAARLSGRAGQRFDSLRALQQAAAIEASPQLRDEAIACLALADIRAMAASNNLVPGALATAIDPQQRRIAFSDSNSRTTIRSLTGHGPEVELRNGETSATGLRFTGNSYYLSAFHGGEGVLRLWDLRQNRIVLQRGDVTDARVAAVSDDQSWIAIGHSGGELEIIDAAKRRTARTFKWSRPISLVEFQPHSSLVAVASAASLDVQVFDAASSNRPVVLPHRAVVRQLLWRRDSPALATVTSAGEISLWTVGRGHASLLRAHNAGALRVAFDSSGSMLAATSKDHALRLWDAGTGKLLVRAEGVTTTNITLLSDGTLVCDAGTRIEQFEVARSTAWQAMAEDGNPGMKQFACAINASGSLAAIATDAGVSLRKVESGEPIGFVHVGATRSVAFDPVTGGLLTGGFFGMHHLPIERTQLAGRTLLLVGPPQTFEARPPIAVCDKPAGSGLFAVAEENELLVFGADRQLMRRLPTGPSVLAISMSHDAHWIAAIESPGGGILVWNLNTGEIVKRWPGSSARQLKFSPDGAFLMATAPGACEAWNVGTWTEAFKMKVENSGRTPTVAFAPDRATFAVGSGNSVLLASTQDGSLLARLEGSAQGGIQALDFTGNSTRLLCVSAAGGAMIWDIRALRSELAAVGLDWLSKPMIAPATTAAPRASEAEMVIRDVAGIEKAQEHIATLREARAILESHADDLKAWQSLAIAQIQLRAYRGAAASATRALALQVNADMLNLRADANSHLDAFGDVINDYHALISDAGYRTKAVKDLAYWYLESPTPWRNPSMAADLARQMLQKDPGDMTALSRLARAAYLEGDFARAVAIGQPLCNSNQLMACFTVAMAKARLGQLAEAEQIFTATADTLWSRDNIDLLKRFYLPLAREAETVIAREKENLSSVPNEKSTL